jgi:hypothetical protein
MNDKENIHRLNLKVRIKEIKIEQLEKDITKEKDSYYKGYEQGCSDTYANITGKEIEQAKDNSI